jgi:hypothetical protein
MVSPQRSPRILGSNPGQSPNQTHLVLSEVVTLHHSGIISHYGVQHAQVLILILFFRPVGSRHLTLHGEGW